MRRVTLCFAPIGSWVALRRLRGDDEESVTAADTAAAIDLLDRLLVDAPGAALSPGNASELTAPDRDRLLADVYATEFGARVDCTVACAACAAPFDIDFALHDLVASLYAARPETDTDGATFRSRDGRRVRAPRGSDELAIVGLAPDARERELVRRCLVDGDSSPDDSVLLDAIDAAAPIIDLELDATCPNCGATQQLNFDLQQFLLGGIVQETSLRTSEIHRLAATYGWGLGDILSLPRARRRAFVAEIERDRAHLAQHWSA